MKVRILVLETIGKDRIVMQDDGWMPLVLILASVLELRSRTYRHGIANAYSRCCRWPIISIPEIVGREDTHLATGIPAPANNMQGP